MKISFVIPCRSNAKYFKWAYDSIRKHQGNHDVYICAANDASQDETVFLFHEIAAKDDKFTYITNPGPERVGHTILYDRIVRELVKTDIAIIWHADMYLCPGALDDIEKFMFTKHSIDDSYSHTQHELEVARESGLNVQLYSGSHNVYGPDGTLDKYQSTTLSVIYSNIPNYKTLVSLTRIEPPLHPDGPEKYLADWGIEPEDFNESAFLQWFTSPEVGGYKPKYDPPYTTGIFAPWAFFVKDFLEIGGHDPLYRPQSKEDSDIFNRFKLNGCKFIQTWKGCTYHMTCRGSRFNPTLTTPGKNSSEWEEHNIKSHRNFIRKWGSPVQHDQFMDPIIPNKYYTKFILKNTTISILKELEPFCDSLKTDLDPNLLQRYFVEESKNTDFDLGLKLSGNIIPSVQVYIDCSILSDEDYKYLFYLSSIIDSSNLEIGFSGTFKLGSLQVQIVMLKPITSTLIHLENSEYKFRLK